jgi:hypothetical protein
MSTERLVGFQKKGRPSPANKVRKLRFVAEAKGDIPEFISFFSPHSSFPVVKDCHQILCTSFGFKCFPIMAATDFQTQRFCNIVV